MRKKLCEPLMNSKILSSLMFFSLFDITQKLSFVSHVRKITKPKERLLAFSAGACYSRWSPKGFAFLVVSEWGCKVKLLVSL